MAETEPGGEGLGGSGGCRGGGSAGGGAGGPGAMGFPASGACGFLPLLQSSPGRLRRGDLALVRLN